jgi:hypothetical protein
MEAGHIAAGGLSDVGRSTGRTTQAGHVRGRRMALVGCAVIAAFGGAFAVGAATSTKGVAPARLAPALGTAQPAALKLSVKPSVSVPGLVRVAKPRAKPKPATVASAPVVAAPVVAAPVVAPVTPVVVTHTGGVPSPPVTVPVTHPAGPTSKPKTTSTGSG